MNMEILKATTEFKLKLNTVNGPLFWPFLKNVFPNGTDFSFIF